MTLQTLQQVKRKSRSFYVIDKKRQTWYRAENQKTDKPSASKNSEKLVMNQHGTMALEKTQKIA